MKRTGWGKRKIPIDRKWWMSRREPKKKKNYSYKEKANVQNNR